MKKKKCCEEYNLTWSSFQNTVLVGSEACTVTDAKPEMCMYLCVSMCVLLLVQSNSLQL